MLPLTVAYGKCRDVDSHDYVEENQAYDNLVGGLIRGVKKQRNLPLKPSMNHSSSYFEYFQIEPIHIMATPRSKITATRSTVSHHNKIP